MTKLDELTRFTYPVPGGSVPKLIQSDTDSAPFAAQVRKDIQSLLRDYDIEDKATLRSLRGTLLMLDEVEGKDDDALRENAVLQELEDKPADRLMSGLYDDAYLAAWHEANGDPMAFQRLINPKRPVELLRARHVTAASSR